MKFKHLISRFGCKLFIDCWKSTTIELKMLQNEIFLNLPVKNDWMLATRQDDFDDRDDNDDDEDDDDNANMR